MPLIILDRDGVINYDSDEYIKCPEEWQPIPGSLEAIAKLNRHGFDVVVATNQSGIARGLYDEAMLARIHAKLSEELTVLGGHVKEFFFCPHHPEVGCVCRKPKPGLLHQIQQKYACQLADIFFIGDALSDVKAAQAAGCKPLLVLTGKLQTDLLSLTEWHEVPQFADLEQAVDYVLSQTKRWK